MSMITEKNTSLMTRVKGIDEIGGEFSLESPSIAQKQGKTEFLADYGDYVLTSSGRGAITHLLTQISPKYNSVLLPEYICDSVIQPFVEQGYNCHYYSINEDLSPNIESIKGFEEIGIFLHIGYFGFKTNMNLEGELVRFKENSTLIIEDLTHSMFSSFEKNELNDFCIGSIRKWVGIPGGGFLASSKKDFKKKMAKDETFLRLRTKALVNKSDYLRKKEVDLKKKMLGQLSEAEMILNGDGRAYAIDNLSTELINSMDVDELKRKRKENFHHLVSGCGEFKGITPIFDSLPENVCPMFYPIFVNGNRDEFRRKLIEQKIYCPIHWPLPNEIKKRKLSGILEMYNTMLSIPCDQRYGIGDMDRIIAVIRSIS